MTSCIGFLISMFRTRMCGQTLLFIVIANGAIEAAQSTVANVQRVFIGSCLEATLHFCLCVILLPQLNNNCEMNISVCQATTVHSVLHFTERTITRTRGLF